jgi:hypothetical protein
MNKPNKQKKDTTMKTTLRRNLIAAALIGALAPNVSALSGAIGILFEWLIIIENPYTVEGLV